MRLSTLLGSALLFCAMACGQRAAEMDLIAVTGTVTLKDGTPLPGALVTFLPSGTTKGIESSGRTDLDGKYRLKTTRGGDGAAAGEHKVTISKLIRPDGSDYVPAETADPATSNAKELLPAIYSDAEKSTLKAMVKSDARVHDYMVNIKKTWK
jgi:hypothetical protein